MMRIDWRKSIIWTIVIIAVGGAIARLEFTHYTTVNIESLYWNAVKVVVIGLVAWYLWKHRKHF